MVRLLCARHGSSTGDNQPEQNIILTFCELYPNFTPCHRLMSTEKVWDEVTGCLISLCLCSFLTCSFGLEQCFSTVGGSGSACVYFEASLVAQQ